MLPIDRHHNRTLILSALLILALTLFAACTSSSTNSGDEPMEEMEEMEHEEEEHMEEGHDEEGDHEHLGADRVPNEGALIRITSPEDGATFAEGEDVVIRVEVDQFALGEDGSHWHVYVDGTSWGMVVGGRSNEALRGLEPGEHLVEVYLAGGDHIELEEGDSITLIVE